MRGSMPSQSHPIPPDPILVRALLPECCTLGSAGLETLPAEQQATAREILPSTKTLLVLALATCAPDLHSRWSWGAWPPICARQAGGTDVPRVR